MFGDDLLASAAMDRLMHHATTISITGESFRNPKARRRATWRRRSGRARWPG
jgi:DNA replication protein DnaC